ncbi:MAG: glycosyltransferase [Erysipelotrichaceae bacterium]|nr:glycosyltransferase [Erysipelotrichaceae bacterium]
MEKLTVVVAIYNVENYLDKCLQSLKEQTCNDYKVYCVNDGSTDGSRDIIMKYVNVDPKFIVLDKPNGGLSDARNYGIERCVTEYISFIDGDDFVSYDYVERSLKEMEEKKLDMLVFAYNQYYLATNSNEKVNLRIANGVYNLKDKKDLLAYTPNAAWNKVYRTSLFTDNNITYPFGYRHQDLGTTPKLLLKSNRVGYINDALYNYLIDRPNNITAQIDKKLYHIIDMSKEVMDYYIENHDFDNYVNEYDYLVKRNFIQSLRKAMKLEDKKFVLKFIDDIFDTSDKYFKKSKHTYQIAEEDGDSVYLSRFKCKAYYILRKLKG